MAKGKVVQVIGPVVDIEFPAGELPAILNAVTIKGKTSIDIDLVVEVMQHLGDSVTRCIAMSSTDGLTRGMEAVDTGNPIMVPVGTECLGRVFNVLGQTVDHNPAPVGNKESWPIHRPAPKFDEQETSAQVGERTREGNDLWGEMTESGVIDKTALVYGQMNEPPGARMRVALTGLTMAEYFRDVQHQDVLLFIDNIFRFIQAGSEVSALLGRMPSAVSSTPKSSARSITKLPAVSRLCSRSTRSSRTSSPSSAWKSSPMRIS